MRALPTQIQEFLGEPLESTDFLRQELEEYLAVARRKLPNSSRQRGLAESIAARAFELFVSQTGEEERKLAQAAVKYLLLTEDAIGDFESPEGLDDDAEVFNAVANYLGRADLVIST